MNNEKMETSDTNQLEDKALKSAMDYFGEELLPVFGVEKKAIRPASTERITLKARQMYEDFEFEMEDGSRYHFEFESDSIQVKDLRRFRLYEAATSNRYNVPVVTHVVCSSDVKSLLSEYTEGINTYRVRVIRLKEDDADELFASLESRPADLTREDMARLVLTPLMGGKMPCKERILRAVRIIKENGQLVTAEEYEKLEAVLYAFAVKFLKKEEIKEVEEVMTMTELGERLVNRGIRMGKAEGKADSILCLLSIWGTVPEELRGYITGVKDVEILDKYLLAAAQAKSIEEFEISIGVK